LQSVLSIRNEGTLPLIVAVAANVFYRKPPVKPVLSWSIPEAIFYRKRRERPCRRHIKLAYAATRRLFKNSSAALHGNVPFLVETDRVSEGYKLRCATYRVKPFPPPRYGSPGPGNEPVPSDFPEPPFT